MLNIKPDRRNEGAVFLVGRLAGGLHCLPAMDKHGIYRKGTPEILRSDDNGKEHIKAQEHEVILVVSTIACYKC